MSEEILDGTGKGYTAKVDSSNRLMTFSITEQEDKYLNINFGDVFSVHFSVTPAGANDYFFYFKNTGTKTVSLTDVRISSSAATNVTLEHVSGTPSYTSDTDLTPTNRNLGSSKTITGTIKSDTDTTGLTSEGVLFHIECPVADTLYHLRTSSNIVIPQGSSIALKRVAASGAIECVVSLVIEEEI